MTWSAASGHSQGDGEQEHALLELIASRREGILAGVTLAGYPHLTNVLYLWDSDRRIARLSTTADGVKGRILRRDRRAALHVPGDRSSYAVAECDAELSEVAATPGDEACRELLALHRTFHGHVDENAFFVDMIETRRLVVRLRLRRIYGVLPDQRSGRWRP
jgi:PPOX class probable F420-dependent enzyme